METKKAESPPRQRIVNAARKLFAANGFHAATTAELASEAAVSVGQIYRLFKNKDEVILEIVQENIQRRVAEMDSIFETVDQGEWLVLDAFKAIAESSMTDSSVGLSFEILAEAYRNPPVAERLARLGTFYRDGVRRMASKVRPDLASDELEAYVEIMLACLIGLGHRPLLTPEVDVEQICHATACLLMRALGVAEQSSAMEL